MLKDIFGNLLAVGDYIGYAEDSLGNGAEMVIYELVTGQDGTVIGEVCSGDAMGCHFYIADTETRAILLRNPFKDADCHTQVTIH